MSPPFGKKPGLQALLKLVLPSGLLLLFLTLIPLYNPALLYQYQGIDPHQKDFQDTSSSLSIPSPSPPPQSAPSPAPPPSPPPQSPPPPPPPPPPIRSPPPPSPPPPPPPTLNARSSTRSGSAKGCNFSVGEWIRDPEAPYYTNNTCFTIQEHQNCMKYGRPDLDFLKWRWKPEGCELPRFDPVRFLELVRSKSMAFVGDSLARNQMQSLMCLLSRVAYPEDISATSDENFKSMYYSLYNFTISAFWSPFLIKAEIEHSKGLNPFPVWKLYVDVADNTWVSHIHAFDYVIISDGNWFNRPSIYYKKGKIIGWQYYKVKKAPYMSLHYPHRMAFRTALQTLNGLGGYRGITFLRTVSPSHFENGAWDKGGDCTRTRPYRSNETSFKGMDFDLYKAQLEEFRRAEEKGRKKGLKFAVLDITAAMLLRPDGHPSRYGHWPQEKRVMSNDCVHWCLPGPVDAWNNLLLQMLST